METALTIIAVVSAAIALAMSAVVVRLLRDDRRRSDDRVAALIRLASSGENIVSDAERVPSRDPSTSLRVGLSPSKAEPRVPSPVLIDELDLQPEVAGVSGLFAEPEQPSPWGRRFAIVASIALLAVIVGFGISSIARGSQTGATSAAATPANPPEATPALELLTLAYENRDGTLTITGIVQNPKNNAQPLAGVEATAQLFDASGAVVASARAPIDFSRLQPGDESPFVLHVPVKGNVARYRVGFRDEDGHVIAHVDRRAAGPLARM
jgi:hypothetical protein